MSYVSELFGRSNDNENTVAEPEPEPVEMSPEEEARELFPARVPEYENYREAVAGAWLFHRIAKIYKSNEEIKSIKQDFVAEKQHFRDLCSDLDGNLPTYKLAWPAPEAGMRITEADREAMGVTDTFNDEMWLPAGSEALIDVVAEAAAGLPSPDEDTGGFEFGEDRDSLTTLPGVGDKIAVNLAEAGFKTASDVLAADADTLLAVTGVGNSHLETWGIDTPEVEPEPELDLSDVSPEDLATALEIVRRNRA